jgi:Ca-activated chloride channel family protein
MARGRYRNARQHRRQTVERAELARKQKRGRAVPPWAIIMVVVVVGVLAVSGGTYGVMKVVASCSGDPVTLSVTASPDQYDTVHSLAAAWTKDTRAVDRRCVKVAVRSEAAAVTARSLTPRWRPGSATPRTDVWMPDSTAWVARAAQQPELASLFPANSPKVATSPIVMAMPLPMAQALGWPNTPVSWGTLAGMRITGVTWQRFGHSEWGQIKLGVGNPALSSSALGTLLPVADANGDGTVATDELKNALVLSRAVALPGSSSTDFLAAVAALPGGGPELATVGPFAATEQQVTEYDSSRAPVKLAAISPREGTIMVDYPYVVLKASWVDSVRQKTASAFLAYVRCEQGRKAYADAGFRDQSGSPRDVRAFSEDLGTGADVPGQGRPFPSVGEVTKTLVFWAALSRRSNLLTVVDTSGSMAERAPVGPGSRMQVVAQSSLRGIALFSPEDYVGSWKFSTKLDGDRDYKELVPLGPVGGTLPDGTPRRAALSKVVYQQLVPHGATGLYDTTLAAYEYMQAHWMPGRLNLISILTDGKNEDDGLTREELITQLRQRAHPDRPILLLVIGYGPDTDLRELTQITAAVGGKAYPAASGADMDRLFLATLFGGT